MIKVYEIECSTGCSCCSEDNHYRGYYKSELDAKKRIEFFKDPDKSNNPVASQYAHKGVYHIREIEGKEVDDYILLYNGKWIERNELININSDGSLVKGDDRLI